MKITDLDFTLLENGNVLVKVTLSVPNLDKSKPPFSIDLEQELDYAQWATASLVIALGGIDVDNGDGDNEDPDDDGTRH